MAVKRKKKCGFRQWTVAEKLEVCRPPARFAVERADRCMVFAWTRFTKECKRTKKRGYRG
jgi:hypothetical protein